MSGELISRSQLLLQYYSALAELEQESRVMVASASAGLQAPWMEVGAERVRQPLFLQKEVRVSL